MLSAAPSLRRALILLAVSAAAPAVAGPPRAPVVEESSAERRAVRGVPVDDATLSESPELRDVRRFEEGAFPRDRASITRQDGPTDVVPPPRPGGGEGRWSG